MSLAEFKGNEKIKKYIKLKLSNNKNQEKIVIFLNQNFKYDENFNIIKKPIDK